MSTAPYSIYVNKRPLRVAFLIEDKPESAEVIDAIIAYNRNRWGGRYNPIVVTDGDTLTDAWWAFLEAIDPDVVKSMVTLSDNLIAGIERRISPYLIEQPDGRDQQGERPHIVVQDHGLSLLPTPANVRAVNSLRAEPRLVLFETDSEEIDPSIKRFTEWNLGGYSPPVEVVNRALEEVRTERYPLTDASSLVASLAALSTPGSFTYPIQLCSIPKEALPPVRNDRFAEMFHVVIGDSPTDVAYFWNRPATIRQWDRTLLKQVWLPSSVVTNSQLAAALNLWIQRLASRCSDRGSIRFVSLSLSQDRLEEVTEPLRSELRVPVEVNALPEIELPDIDDRSSERPTKDRMDLHRVTSTKERLTLQEPDVRHGFWLDEHWMADLYIEFRPERYPTIMGRPLWWRLPRLNALASQIFRRPSRILRNRYPSVLMKRGEPRLDVTLPDDMNVFIVLAALPNDPYYTTDARHEKELPGGRRPYHQARRSDKGRYLSGLLELFCGLHPATTVLEDRYWRRMLDQLSGRSAHSDAQRVAEVGNKLRKRLGANRSSFYNDDRSMTWLTNYVLKVARSLPVASRDLGFAAFEDQAKREVEDFNTGHPGQEPWLYSQEDLLRALAGLTERTILLIGVRARCPSCGYRAWHHIDDAKQNLRCGGCNAQFPMPPEQRWRYRLNSLIQAAYAQHGLLPVVLVLGQLLMEARSAFVFTPCLDLFENDDNGPVGDLDIAVICDGQFVIGEVKQSRDLFDAATFAKTEDVARRLLPDVLLFASMDRQPNELIAGEISRLTEALRPLRIAVRWYELHEHKFEASPVR